MGCLKELKTKPDPAVKADPELLKRATVAGKSETERQTLREKRIDG